MSTWAARLAMSGRTSDSCTQASGAKTPFMNYTSPSEGSASSSVNISLSSQAVIPTGIAYWDSKKETLLEEFLALAAHHNRNLDKVPALRLPMDTWEYISFFLSYIELLRLAGTCHSLWDRIMQRDSMWEHQLCFWHRDIMDLRGGALLLTAFLFERKCTGYERFKRQRLLYTFDAHREWHFRELETLEDVPTGFFTVALHLGRENTESDTVAPIAGELSRGSLGGSPNNATPPARLPAVGQPFVGAEDTAQRLRIWRPVRPGEADGATRGNASISAAKDPVVEALGHYPLDAPTSAAEEEAMVRYALACSEAEMKGLSPPPPLFPRPPRRGDRRSLSRENPRLSASGSPFAASLGGGGSLSGSPCLKPSEIMTLTDLLNSGTPASSLIPLIDVTAAEDELVLLAMAETLKGARRRRLHLGNHHRALANNGQTTRRRRLGLSMPGAAPPAVRELSGRPSNEQYSLPLPPPPVNAMLRGFTGVLLEVYPREAYRICEELLGSSQRLDDFILFHPTSSPWGKEREGGAGGFGAGTRFFVAPELCRGSRIGLIVVDMVRMLIVVEDERTARDDPAWVQGYARVDRGGRLVVPGHGYNAQYYERSELRPL